jgi:hypothetical protein
MENASHNANQTAHNAEKVKRAQMAIEALRGAVGCGHTGDAVERATRAVYAQKNGILSVEGRHTHNEEVFGGAARTWKSARLGRSTRAAKCVLGDVLHAPMVCDISRHKKTPTSTHWSGLPFISCPIFLSAEITHHRARCQERCAAVVRYPRCLGAG